MPFRVVLPLPFRFISQIKSSKNARCKTLSVIFTSLCLLNKIKTYFVLLSQKMEKFKIVERETKTKAYSKEGLTSGQKLDPAERERADISQWLNQCIETLNIQMDQFEAEIENLSNTKKKKGRNDQAEQIDDLNSLLEKHRDHVQKLETLLRMLDNNTVEINQIKDIKDDLDYYIENCQDPEFIENEEIYEDIDGLEEMLLDVRLLLFHAFYLDDHICLTFPIFQIP